MDYQINSMVCSSGGFKFKDFVVVGETLQLIMTIVVPILIKMNGG